MVFEKELSENTKRLLKMDITEMTAEMQSMSYEEVDQVLDEVQSTGMIKVGFFRLLYKLKMAKEALFAKVGWRD